MSDDETVKQSFVSGVNDNSNTDWERYADKALVIDVENTEADDKTAATTELTSGQYGIVVYNDDGQAEVVYVTDTYKMEVDVDAGDDDNANNDRITSTTVDGVKTPALATIPPSPRPLRMPPLCLCLLSRPRTLL